MTSKSRLAFFVLTIFSLCLLTCGRIPSRHSQTGQGKMGIVPSRIKFVHILPCDESDRGEMCVSGMGREVLPNQKITILGPKKDQICQARTGESTWITTEIEGFNGTKLTDIRCQSLEVGSLAVVEEAVANYEELQCEKVGDAKTVAHFNKKIKEDKAFKRFQA